MEKAGKEKYGTPYLNIIIWHHVYRMHEMNNAAIKDASLSVYFQPGMSRPTCSILQSEITDGVSSE